MDGAKNQPTGDINGPDTEVMLALCLAEGLNMDRVRFYLAEEHTSGFHSAPRITEIAAHGCLCNLRDCSRGISKK